MMKKKGRKGKVMKKSISIFCLLIIVLFMSCILIDRVEEKTYFKDALWYNDDTIIVIGTKFMFGSYDSIFILLIDINNKENNRMILKYSGGYYYDNFYIENNHFFYQLGNRKLYYYDIPNENLSELTIYGSYEKYNVLEDEMIYINDDNRLEYYSLLTDSHAVLNDEIMEIYYVDWSERRIIAGIEDYIVQFNFDSLIMDTVAAYKDTVSIVVGLYNPRIFQDLYDTTQLLMEGNENAVLVLDKLTDIYSFKGVIDSRYFRRNRRGDFIEVGEMYLSIFHYNDDLWKSYNFDIMEGY